MEPDVVVLVHGGFHNAACWASTAAALRARGHQVLSVNLRGHAGAPMPPAPWWWPFKRVLKLATLGDFVADVHAAVARDVPAGAAIHVVGHSSGTGVAQAFVDSVAKAAAAADAPATVTIRSMALVAPFPPNGGGWRIFARWVAGDVLLWLWAVVTFNPFAMLATVSRYKRWMWAAETSDALVQAHLDKLDRDESVVVPATYAFTSFASPTRILGLLASPRRVAVFGGAVDRLMTPATVHAVAQAYRVQPRIIAGGAHNLMLDTASADVFVEQLDAFIKSNSSCSF